VDIYLIQTTFGNKWHYKVRVFVDLDTKYNIFNYNIKVNCYVNIVEFV